MILLIIYGILFLVQIFAPAWIGIILFLVNLLIPEPVPFVDEVLQAGILVAKLAAG